MQNLSLSSPSKIGVDGYAASSFVSADLEASVFSDAYAKCSDFQTKYAALRERVGSDNHQTFSDYTIRNGLLIDGLKSRVCVPTSRHGRLLEFCHDSPLGGHTDARKLKYEMMPQFFGHKCLHTLTSMLNRVSIVRETRAATLLREAYRIRMLFHLVDLM